MKPEKKLSRYTHDATEMTTPETGHTMLLPSEEKDLIEMDPHYDPQLHWSGKKKRNTVPILPLQRNEIVSESRVAQIIERARKAAREKSGQKPLSSFFELEKAFRDKDRSGRVEFYRHQERWKNKLICGDSLLVMESLIHYEQLRGAVQMIYFDPPYGIKYDSNFQQRVDSTSNDQKDRSDDILTIKAFNDTWLLGVHSYLSHLQDRLYLCRELLHETGSVFVQTSDQNMHLVRCILDEVFGRENFCALISFSKTVGQSTVLLPSVMDFILWYARDKTQVKYHKLYMKKELGGEGATGYTFVESPDGKTFRSLNATEVANPSTIPKGWRVFDATPLVSQGFVENLSLPFTYEGRKFTPPSNRHWTTTKEGMETLGKRNRLVLVGNTLQYKRYFDDFPLLEIGNVWMGMGERGFVGDKLYVVQTAAKVISRCLLMSTDPGDLVFDPTCGSGTTAYCAEMLGRRWITCDTSRVAINVTRKRLLASVFKHYKTRNKDISSGFMYSSVPHVTLKAIANNLEPERVELVDDPAFDKDVIRVVGPFEVMLIGRYSVEDWRGYVREDGKLENYVEVICRLYRKDAATQGASGLVHATVESQGHRIGISVGPLSGRVTANQISDAMQDAVASGINEIHVLGWAFEANVGEMKSKLESRSKVSIQLIMIRPDTLVEGLKATTADTLFSPYALPDVEVSLTHGGNVTVTLKGVAIFDRKSRSTEYMRADSGYVSAWYLDEDYDGDCFVDCQMFFGFPARTNLDRLAGVDIDKTEMQLQLISRPFLVRGYKRIAIKVVDVFGNESTLVKDTS